MADVVDPELDALTWQLSSLASRINTTETHLERLYDQRRGVFRKLVEKGMSKREIARRSGISDMAVGLAIGTIKPKKRTTKKAAPKKATAGGKR